VIHACLGYNAVAIQTQLMGTEPLTKKMLGNTRSISEIDSTHCINKAIACSEKNNNDHISENVLMLLTGKIK
jgi:hypothetical protein